jgi:uncharacterized protein (TIGR03435 family)
MRFHCRALVVRASAAGTEIDSQWIGFDKMLQAPGPTGQVFTNTPMPAMAMAVSASIGNNAGPVVDMTRLQERYDFILRVASRPRAENPPQAPDDRFAINKVVPVEMLVLDHVDKVPTEN